MALNHDLLNAGLTLAMEFGENWLEPIQSRLAERFPELNARERNECDKVCRAAMRFGHQQVAAALRVDVSGGDAARAVFNDGVLARFPWIDDANLGHLWSQGCYYAWKDGWTGGPPPAPEEGKR